MKSLVQRLLPSKRARSVKARNRGVLAVIGTLLVGSALARVAGHADAAMALEPAAAATPEPSQETVMASELPGCAGNEDIAPILEALRAREDRILAREQALETRLQALALAETEIDRKLAAMEETEAKLRATLAIAESAAETDVAQLTQVYANMKPKQAALLFEEMDPEFAAGFLGRMRPEAAAAIMAGLSPPKAYTVSVLLAGRNAAAPKD